MRLDDQNVWQGFNAAGIIAALYLFALVIYATRKPFPRAIRLAAFCVGLVTGAGVAFNWISATRSSGYQREFMGNLQGFISRSVMLSEMPADLLKIMRTYSRQQPGEAKTLGDLFREEHPGVHEGDNIHKRLPEGDSLGIYVARLSQGEVTLIGEHANLPGRDPAFKNYKGGSGRVQERATLTEKGVRYESEN